MVARPIALSSPRRWVALGVLAGCCFFSAGPGAAEGAGAARDRFIARLVGAALERTKTTHIYDPSYRVLAYPGGDVPDDRGVCTDVIVRSYRAVGIDLQQRVHEDMRRRFGVYPRRWGLKRPDRNIDHRRVPNLRVFLTRHGEVLPVGEAAQAYKPGDLVTWDLAVPASSARDAVQGSGERRRQERDRAPSFARTPHIGIVTDKMSGDGRRPLIVHNIGSGTELSDILFSFRITGHYRYRPDDPGR
jgi:uncharacterized protein YijF (DUF1287 family)